MIVFGAIAPHGGIVLDGDSPTRAAMEELGQRHEAAAPDATIVLTPHGIHLEDSFAVVTAGTVAGDLGSPDTRLSCTVERVLAHAVVGQVAPAVES